MKNEVIIVLVSLLIFSCSIGNILDTSGNYDYEDNGDLADTVKNSNLITSNFAAAIRMEASGKYPGTDWLSSWRGTIKANRSRNTSDAKFYIKYIIEERRKKGLPEL